MPGWNQPTAAQETPLMETADELTPAVQDYLKAIHSLGGAERLVLPVEIADRLHVRPPSVTGMLKRLAEAARFAMCPARAPN